MADQTLELELRVKGVEEAIQKLNRTRDAVDENGTTVVDAGRKWGEMGGAIGNVASVAGQSSPQFAALGGVLGQVGSASSALTGAMGPLGVAMAGITTAVGLYRVAADRAREQQEALRASTDRLRLSYDELLSSIQQVNAAQQVTERLQGGVGTREEFEARARQFENRVSELDLAINRITRGDADAGPENSILARLQSQRRAARREAESMRAQIERGDAEGFTTELESSGRGAGFGAVLTDEDLGIRSGGGRGGTDPVDEMWARRNAAIEDIRQRQLEADARIDEAKAGFHEQELARQAELEDKENLRIQEELAAVQHRNEVEEEAHAQAIRRLEEQKAAQREANEKLKADAEGVLGPAVQSITAAVGEMILGTKTAEEAFQGMLSSFLQMIAEQAALSAVKEYAEAIAAFARYDMASGAQHLAAGVAFTGVAVAAGVGSAAVAPAAASAPASPQGGAGAPAGGGGGGNVTYNINGTIISSGGSSERARAGRELGALVSEGASRYGRAA